MENFTLFLSVILSTIIVIVFFISASNISKIKKVVKSIRDDKWRDELDSARLYDMRGVKDKALHHYINCYYYYKNYNLPEGEIVDDFLVYLGKHIRDSGGEIPKIKKDQY